jgi:hypothetical protein
MQYNDAISPEATNNVWMCRIAPIVLFGSFADIRRGLWFDHSQSPFSRQQAATRHFEPRSLAIGPCGSGALRSTLSLAVRANPS